MQVYRQLTLLLCFCIITFLTSTSVLALETTELSFGGLQSEDPPSTAILFLFDESDSIEEEYRAANYDLARFYLVLLRTYYTQEWGYEQLPEDNVQAASRISLGVSRFAHRYDSSPLPLTTLDRLSDDEAYDLVYEALNADNTPEELGTDTDYVNAFKHSAHDLNATDAEKKVLVLLTDSDEYHDNLLGDKQYRDSIAAQISDTVSSGVDMYVSIWGTDVDQEGDTTLDFWRARRDEKTVKDVLNHENIYQDISKIDAIKGILPSQHLQGGWLHTGSTTIEFPGVAEQGRIVEITSKPTKQGELVIRDEYETLWGKENYRGPQWFVIDGHIVDKNNRSCPLHKLTINWGSPDLEEEVGYYWFETQTYTPKLKDVYVSPSQWVINEKLQEESLSVEIDFQESAVDPTYPHCYSVRTEIGLLENTLSEECLCDDDGLENGLVHSFDGKNFPIGLPWQTIPITVSLVYSEENGSVVQDSKNASVDLVYEPVVLTEEIGIETTASWEVMEKEKRDDVVHSVTFTIPIKYAVLTPDFLPLASLSMSSTRVITKTENSCVHDSTIDRSLVLIEEGQNTTNWYQVTYDYRGMLEDNCYPYLLVRSSLPNNDFFLESYDIEKSIVDPTPTPKPTSTPCTIDVPGVSPIPCVWVAILIVGIAISLLILLLIVTKFPDKFYS